ncbi:MAG: hypothetical protein LBU48_02250 [Coriobacteriales bacterium]|nr:hypothetical protein [Coriobacteriales bacterium]
MFKQLGNAKYHMVTSTLTELGVTDDAYADELEKFYASKVFAILSNQETALWHLSPATLAQMYNDEIETGNFDIPEEQS